MSASTVSFQKLNVAQIEKKVTTIVMFQVSEKIVAPVGSGHTATSLCTLIRVSPSQRHKPFPSSSSPRLLTISTIDTLLSPSTTETELFHPFDGSVLVPLLSRDPKEIETSAVIPAGICEPNPFLLRMARSKSTEKCIRRELDPRHGDTVIDILWYPASLARLRELTNMSQSAKNRTTPPKF